MKDVLNSKALLHSVGSTLITKNGDKIGKIIEITRDKKNGTLEYVILKSEVFFGRGERVFAIPASPDFIDFANAGDIVLKLPKDELQFAKGVSADKCPKPNLKFGKSIYELYQYQAPMAKNSTAA